MVVVIYQDRANKWRWKILGHDNSVLAFSGSSFSTCSNAKRAIENIVKNCRKQIQYFAKKEKSNA